MTPSRFGVLLLFPLLASQASAQGSGGHLGVVTPEVQPTAQLFPDESVRALWDRVRECAGAKRDTTKTFEQIVFLERAPTYFQGSLLKGEWVPPDTIYLTTSYESVGWVVAHEMLHHLLNGPPGIEKHPFDPFLFPCRLLEFQQPTPGQNNGTTQRSAWNIP